MGKKFEAYKKTAKYSKYQEFKEKADKKMNKFKKDENAPKRPASAYFCFLAERRDGAKEDFPELPHKAVMKKLGELWNKLSEAQKKPFEKEAAKQKAAYEKALAKYQQSSKFKKYQKAKQEHQDSLKAAKKEAAKKVKKSKS